MIFGYPEASTSELRVSENSATSSYPTGWARLTPYLTLKYHVLIIFATCILLHLVVMVPWTIDIVQKAHTRWWKMPYIWVLFRNLCERCVIKKIPDSGKHGMTEPSAERSAELFSKTSEMVPNGLYIPMYES